MDPLSSCARLAAGQYGVIARGQALEAGLSTDSIDRLLRSGAWIKLHPRVYALWASDESWRQRLMAACLWLGAGSAVSHLAAGTMLELDGFEVSPLEFSTTGRCRTGRGNLIVHRVHRLPATDIERVGNIPTTTATRTLIDLGAVADAHLIELALESALRKGLTSPEVLRRRLEQIPRRAPNLQILRRLVGERPFIATESALETLVWQLLLGLATGPPQRQYEIVDLTGGFVARVDFAYRNEMVAIEAHGFSIHSSSEAFHRDRRRDAALAALGWIVYRVTWADVHARAPTVAREIVELLARRSEVSVLRPDLLVSRNS